MEKEKTENQLNQNGLNESISDDLERSWKHFQMVLAGPFPSKQAKQVKTKTALSNLSQK